MVLAIMFVDLITPSTAPWSEPPSEVKSFWYSISTTAVCLGFTVPSGEKPLARTTEDINRAGMNGARRDRMSHDGGVTTSVSSPPCATRVLHRGRLPAILIVLPTSSH